MSEQRKRRDSLLRSSISINSIRDSVSNFSKGLAESNAVANQIVEKTRQNNLFKSTLIRKENDYFRKRRENVRRKDREDELESSSITGITKKEGNIVQRSTRGFLGRILDFFGIILIGWFVNTLPKILKAIQALISRIQKFIGLLTGFIDGLKDFFTGIGEGIRTAFESLPKFELDSIKSEVDETIEKLLGGLERLQQDFIAAAREFGRPEKLGMESDDIKDGVLDYGEEIESEMETAFQEMGALEGGEGGEDVSEEELDNFINSLDEGGGNEEEQNQEQINDKGVDEEELIIGVKDATTSAEKVVKSEKDFKDGKTAATKNDANKIKSAMNFLNPGGSGGAGGAGGSSDVGAIDKPQREGPNFQEKLDDALARKEEYEETGDMEKLEGVQKKIEFYESVIASQEKEIDPSNYLTIRKNKRPDLKTDKNQNAPTVIITEGKSQIVKVNSMPNLSNTLNIPESNSNDNFIVKAHSLILNS